MPWIQFTRVAVSGANSSIFKLFIFESILGIHRAALSARCELMKYKF